MSALQGKECRGKSRHSENTKIVIMKKMSKEMKSKDDKYNLHFPVINLVLDTKQV